jgi:hypothetical protein
MGESAKIIAWQPQEGPQDLFVRCPAFEAFYGGAVGGGKTDALLGDFARGIELGSAWVGVYFRKHFPDMDDVIRRSFEIFGPVYGRDCYSASKYQWNFPTGAILQFRALERDDDVYKFQGQQFAHISFDELTQWASPFPYTYMMTRLRSAKGAPVRMRAASNPANVGHAWVKARFIDPMPAGIPLLVETKSGNKYHRVFIKSRLEDNKILMRNDPGYSDRIYEVDPSLAKALREGNWNIVAGAAFPEFSEQHHVIDNYPIPTDRPCWRSLDWGYDTPYGNLWMFPSNDAELILGGELYGWSGKPNVGTKESPAEVRHKIAMFEALHEIYVPYGMLDNQCWEERGLPSQIVKELSGNQYDEYRLNWQPWKKGPNSRVQQKQLIHGLMAVTNGKSRLKIMRAVPITRSARSPIIQQKPSQHRGDVERRQVRDHLYDAPARRRDQETCRTKGRGSAGSSSRGSTRRWSSGDAQPTRRWEPSNGDHAQIEVPPQAFVKENGSRELEDHAGRSAASLEQTWKAFASWAYLCEFDKAWGGLRQERAGPVAPLRPPISWGPRSRTITPQIYDTIFGSENSLKVRARSARGGMSESDDDLATQMRYLLRHQMMYGKYQRTGADGPIKQMLILGNWPRGTMGVEDDQGRPELRGTSPTPMKRWMETGGGGAPGPSFNDLTGYLSGCLRSVPSFSVREPPPARPRSRPPPAPTSRAWTRSLPGPRAADRGRSSTTCRSSTPKRRHRFRSASCGSFRTLQYLKGAGPSLTRRRDYVPVREP